MRNFAGDDSKICPLMVEKAVEMWDCFGGRHVNTGDVQFRKRVELHFMQRHHGQYQSTEIWTREGHGLCNIIRGYQGTEIGPPV